ncbi:odorant receptor 22c-like isoform X2 [Leptopilina boulardi]|uniref:odorant receptor 22c-like isoform X2 n=1 Tax=Leptopilina boulardi TaxID=63433 RepID=UPI0021F67D26|nr:odorant receptor 22c-like isoform X2 [Leptopilina boulardi]
MKDIFDNRYFYINKFLMSFIGQWPFHSARRNFVIQCFIVFSISSFFIVLIGGVIQVRHNTSKMMEGFPLIFTAFNSFVYFIVCSFKRNMLFRLFNDIKCNLEFWSSEKEQLIILHHVNNGRILTIYCTGILIITTILFISTSLTPQILNIVLPLNESRPKKFPFQVYYNVDCPEDYFYFITVHLISIGIIIVFIIIGAESVFSVLTEHACALFKIVSLQLQKIDPTESETENLKVLVLCIEHHKRAIDPYFLLMLVAYSAFIAVCLIEIVLNLNNIETFLRSVATLSTGLIYIFLNSFMVQRFMDYSTALSDTIYQGNWYEMSLKIRKILLLIMMRSRIPCKVTCGKMRDLTLINVSSLLQTSFSSFTLLMSVTS